MTVRSYSESNRRAVLHRAALAQATWRTSPGVLARPSKADLRDMLAAAIRNTAGAQPAAEEDRS